MNNIKNSSVSKISRRSFGIKFSAATVLPILFNPAEVISKISIPQEQDTIKLSLPDKITGRELSEEEKKLTEEFLTNHLLSMENIHSRDLPYELLPAFIPKYPHKRKKRNKNLIDED